MFFDEKIKGLGQFEVDKPQHVGILGLGIIEVPLFIAAIGGAVYGIVVLIGELTKSRVTRRLEKAEVLVKAASADAEEAIALHKQALEAGSPLFDEKGRPVGTLRGRGRKALLDGQGAWGKAIRDFRSRGCAILPTTKKEEKKFEDDED